MGGLRLGHVAKGVTYDADNKIISCLFCNFARRTDAKPLLFEDDHCVAFLPLDIAAEQHILVVPKTHIKTVNDLRTEDASLAAHMRQVATATLTQQAAAQARTLDPRDIRLTYHAPPFNSIDHLHLHAFEMPFAKNPLLSIKYAPWALWCKQHEDVERRLTAAAAVAAEAAAPFPEP
ncbi:HIT-like domain-containing protein [Tribonema minus]|uniref:HIT-like domain-containing protein n=1 Tax=Tribonema minus TaxID=303371 RepID=A0A835YJP7_9STRA|nr:HIT-like domain-containing protein [Tribonema minus]